MSEKELETEKDCFGAVDLISHEPWAEKKDANIIRIVTDEKKTKGHCYDRKDLVAWFHQANRLPLPNYKITPRGRRIVEERLDIRTFLLIRNNLSDQSEHPWWTLVPLREPSLHAEPDPEESDEENVFQANGNEEDENDHGNEEEVKEEDVLDTNQYRDLPPNDGLVHGASFDPSSEMKQHVSFSIFQGIRNPQEDWLFLVSENDFRRTSQNEWESLEDQVAFWACFQRIFLKWNQKLLGPSFSMKFDPESLTTFYVDPLNKIAFSTLLYCKLHQGYKPSNAFVRYCEYVDSRASQVS